MNITLAEITPEDWSLIERWLGAKHVVRYWGDPEENRRLLSDSSTQGKRAIIVADERRVGLILWQHPTRHELDVAGCPIPLGWGEIVDDRSVRIV